MFLICALLIDEILTLPLSYMIYPKIRKAYSGNSREKQEFNYICHKAKGEVFYICKTLGVNVIFLYLKWGWCNFP